MRASAVPDDYVIMLSAADVSKAFKQVNNHKDVYSEHALGKCLH
jgi:hypothetical protein